MSNFHWRFHGLWVAGLLGLSACGQAPANPQPPHAQTPGSLEAQGLPYPIADFRPNLEIKSINHVVDTQWVVTGTTSSRFDSSTVNKLQLYLNDSLVASTDPAEYSLPGMIGMYYKNPVGTNGGDWYSSYWVPSSARSYKLSVKAYDSLGLTRTVTRWVLLYLPL